jgi:hypothetical protein
MRHKYKINDVVILKHAGAYVKGVITKLTYFTPKKINAKKISTYTINGNTGLIYPLVGVDGTMAAGNILSKDTKAGYVLEGLQDEVAATSDDNRIVYKTYTISKLQSLCKDRKLPYYGAKRVLIDRLLLCDKMR